MPTQSVLSGSLQQGIGREMNTEREAWSSYYYCKLFIPKKTSQFFFSPLGLPWVAINKYLHHWYMYFKTKWQKRFVLTIKTILPQCRWNFLKDVPIPIPPLLFLSSVIVRDSSSHAYPNSIKITCPVFTMKVPQVLITEAEGSQGSFFLSLTSTEAPSPINFLPRHYQGQINTNLI